MWQLSVIYCSSVVLSPPFFVFVYFKPVKFSGSLPLFFHAVVKYIDR
jgi:hypothetical protein